MSDPKRHIARPAVPTLGLAAGLLASAVLVWTSVLSGSLPLWAGCLLMLVLDYWWFTPLHEASHGNVAGRSGGSRLDAAVGWVSAFFFVAPYPAFRLLHLRHHGKVNEEHEDPDLWVAGRTPLSVLLRCLTILPHYYVFLFGKLREESAKKRRIAVQSGLGLAVYGGLAVLLWRTGHGAEAAFLWLIPGWLSSSLLAFLFDYLPHHPHTDSGRWTNANVRLGGAVLTVLMAGQNYHLVHHLFPRVPFYRYGALYRDLRPELTQHGATILGTSRDG